MVVLVKKARTCTICLLKSDDVRAESHKVYMYAKELGEVRLCYGNRIDTEGRIYEICIV